MSGVRRLAASLGVGAVAAATLACGCGGASASVGRPVAGRVDPPRLLFDYAAERVSTLRAPSEAPDELAASIRHARGTARLELQTKLAVANLWAAESEPDERAARRQRRTAERAAAEVARRSRDPWVVTAMDLVSVMAEWRDGAAGAPRSAERFTTRHFDGGELLIVGWLVRGEIALAAERYEDAATAFRFLLGQLDHPLYVFALWRTARCYQGLGRTADARQALHDADDMGHRRGTSPQAQRVAATARAELGLPPRVAGEVENEPAAATTAGDEERPPTAP